MAPNSHRHAVSKALRLLKEKRPLRLATGAIGLLFAMIYVIHFWRMIVVVDEVRNIDIWYYIQLANAFTVNSAESMSDGLYPIGVTFLVRSARLISIDVLLPLRFAALIGMAVSILSIVLLVRSTTETAISTLHLALLASTFLALNHSVVYYGSYEGAELLASSLQLLSLSIVLCCAKRTGRCVAFPYLLAGISVGFAYLLRYTAVLTLPLIAMIVIFQSPLHRVKRILLFMIGAVATMLPQLLPSAIVHHNPFYSTQAKNIWFGIYGHGDFINRWSLVPNDIRISTVIALNPVLFLRHVIDQMFSYVVDMSLHTWAPIAYLFLLIGLLQPLIAPQKESPTRLVILLAIHPLIIFATAAAWLAPRFLLLPYLIECVIAVSGFIFLYDNVASRIRVAALPVVIAIAPIAILSSRLLLTVPPTSEESYQVQVSRTLDKLGLTDHRAIGTNDPYLHQATSIYRQRYVQLNSINPQPKDLDDLLVDPWAAPLEYLLINPNSIHGDGDVLLTTLLRDPCVVLVSKVAGVYLLRIVQPACCPAEAGAPPRPSEAHSLIATLPALPRVPRTAQLL